MVELELKLIEIVMTNMTETDSDITRDDITRDDRDEIVITKGYKSITKSYRRERGITRSYRREREGIGTIGLD